MPFGFIPSGIFMSKYAGKGMDGAFLYVEEKMGMMANEIV